MPEENNMKKRKWDQVKYSYAAASLFPIKILLNNGMVREIRKNRKIPIVHIQLNPTNKCTRSCSFCSCANRDKNLELSYDEIMIIMEKAKKCGCQSTTITGGGEPMCHPKINEIITDIRKMGIEVGLVTNGDLLKKLDTETMKYITWCRISESDYGTFDEVYAYKLHQAIIRGPMVDWAFSYVVMKVPDYDKMEKVIKFANDHNFTHVRLVSDLLDLDNVPNMDIIRKKIESMKVDDNLVNYQERKDFGDGDTNCWISILKPVVGADGYIYPCCGTQYALEKPSLDYEKTMRMGKAIDMDKIYEDQKCFDGSICAKCYYKDYNYLLNLLLTEMKHVKFV